MAAATSPAPVISEGPKFEIVSKIDSVPVIHDSVTYAHGLLTSNKLTASLYQTALGVASKSYEAATPVLVKTKPLLESADGFAVATFDRVSSTFPYPFTTPTGEFIVVKQAKGVYDGTVHPVVTEVIAKTTAINSAIGARASATITNSQDLAHSLLEQLKHLAEHGKEIPTALIDSVGKTSSDISGIVFSKEGTLQEKSNKLTTYLKEQAKPLVDEIYNYIISAKIKAGEGKEAVAETVDKAKDAVADTVAKVADKVDQANGTV